MIFSCSPRRPFGTLSAHCLAQLNSLCESSGVAESPDRLHLPTCFVSERAGPRPHPRSSLRTIPHVPHPLLSLATHSPRSEELEVTRYHFGAEPLEYSCSPCTGGCRKLLHVRGVTHTHDRLVRSALEANLPRWAIDMQQLASLQPPARTRLAAATRYRAHAQCVAKQECEVSQASLSNSKISVALENMTWP